MAEERHNTVTISTISILKVVAVLLLLWFLFEIRAILLLLLISVIISSAMDPVADYLRKKHVPRGLSVILVYLLFIGIAVLFVYLMAPAIGQQFHEISQGDFLDKLNSKLGIFKENLNQLGISQSIETNIKNWAGSISGSLFETTKGIFNGIISTLTVLVISFYLTAEENGMKNFVKQLVPFKSQAYAMGLVTKIQRKIGAWVLGQLILSVIIFGLTFLGLTFLKIDFALALALTAGLLEIIPYVGPFISVLPAAFFAFLQNPPLALAVIILYVVIQQLENHIIVPVVMSKSVGLSPVLIILGILVGGTLGGIVGAILAIPLIGAASVFVHDMWGNDE